MNRARHPLLSTLAALAALSLAACEGSPPCTQCPNVAGVYEITFARVEADQSSCRGVLSIGVTALVTLEQDGSALSFVESGFPLDGILRENNTAFINTRESIVGDSGLEYSASAFITFEGTEGAMTFKGDLIVRVVEPQCTITVPIEARQLASRL